MPYTGLSGFVTHLEKKDELHRIKTFVNPLLEITEITDRITKSHGKALLFENTGTRFPLLINAFGSDSRMAMAMSRINLDEAGKEIVELFDHFTEPGGNIFRKISALPYLVKLAGWIPVRKSGKGHCQNVIHKDPDLSMLPVLKCWPHDGGRFITLPMVHTRHPLTGKTNVGMYRIQILDRNIAAMHWQLHKTGANHFEAWKKAGKIMPVSVALGGDPVYTYSATAPLPENFDEYILAGFLRGKKVKLVKCITNDLYVPEDADIVIEGYVDPSEDPVWEGPFGDHTGFYSLADWYPRYHVTAITHSKDAIYPATIVGIPPMEDAWLTKATEKIFLAPLKLALQPEIEDFHMPDAGTAHNLVIVRINKSYPGQGKKVISSLFGAGQLMFTKYLVVVSGDINIRGYKELFRHVVQYTDLRSDLIFTSGPLDILDHTSDTYALGGKLGIDATVKLEGETDTNKSSDKLLPDNNLIREMINVSGISGKLKLSDELPLIVAGINQSEEPSAIEKAKDWFGRIGVKGPWQLMLVVDHTVDINNLFMIAWQVLGNSDPKRDIKIISPGALFIDGTAKTFRKGGFPRKWPNIVCSSDETVKSIDKKWDSLGIGPMIPSPSDRYSGLLLDGTAEVLLKP